MSCSLPPFPGFSQDIPVSSQDTPRSPVPATEGRPLEDPAIPSTAPATTPAQTEGGEEEEDKGRVEDIDGERERDEVLDSEMLRQRRLQRFYSVPVNVMDRKEEKKEDSD